MSDDDIEHEEDDYASTISYLQNIFSFLDTADKCNVALVCSFYEKIVTAPVLWPHLYLTPENISTSIPQRFNTVKTLIIDFSESDASLNLNIIHRFSHTVENIVLKNIYGFNDSQIQTLFSISFENLSSLSIVLCDSVTSAGIEHITQTRNLPSLRSLHLRYLSNITPIPKCKLQELDISVCPSVNDSTVEELVQTNPRLSSLHFTQNTRFYMPTFRSLLDFDLILKLNLSNCVLVDDRCLGYIAQLSKLQVLSISGCYSVSDFGIEYLSGNVPLEYFDMSGCARVTDRGVSYLKKTDTLRVLDLSFLYTLSEKSVESLSELKHLKHCYIVGCNDISNASIQDSETRYYFEDSPDHSFTSRAYGRNSSALLMDQYGINQTHESNTLLDLFDFGVQLTILSYLPHNDLNNMCLVSRHFYVLASTPSLYQKFTIYQRVNDWKLQEWILSGSFVRFAETRSLHLDYQDSISTQGITQLFELLPNVKHLAFITTKQMDLPVLQQLDSLKIQSIEGISISRTLSSLTLYGIERWGGVGLRQLPTILFKIPTLVEFCMQNCEGDLNDYPKPAKELVSPIEKLSFDTISVHGFNRYEENLPNVTVLSLKHPVNIFVYINLNLPNLQEIYLLGETRDALVTLDAPWKDGRNKTVRIEKQSTANKFMDIVRKSNVDAKKISILVEQQYAMFDFKEPKDKIDNVSDNQNEIESPIEQNEKRKCTVQ